jgi:hypothetical protein
MEPNEHNPQNVATPETFLPVSNEKPENRSEVKKLLCPSAPAKVKSILLGAIQVDGSVAYVKDKIEVTQEFLDIIKSSGHSPETKFRFSATCIGSACKQWANNGCSVPNRVADILPNVETSAVSLPNCSIRDQCRWFYQQGSSACQICPLVVTRGS